jgi:acetyl esterase/lipase
MSSLAVFQSPGFYPVSSPSESIMPALLVWRRPAAVAFLLIGCLGPMAGPVATAADASSRQTAVVRPMTLDLWPAGSPGKPADEIGPEQEITRDPPDGIVRLTNVTRPQVTVFHPEQPNGTAVLVCPGGGYKILAYEHEGSAVCEFLNHHGVTAVLLKYRVPAPPEQPLQDAQRALGVIHQHAREWNIDPQRIGMLGFSAGGHLTIRTGLQGTARSYPFDPAVDIEDPTPAFLVAIYPAYLVPRGTEGPLADDIVVTEGAPPMCLIHAGDDPWTASGSALLSLAYKQRGIPCELHVFAKGGHGFGIKPGPLPANRWPDRVIEWMHSMGYLPASEGVR